MRVAGKNGWWDTRVFINLQAAALLASALAFPHALWLSGIQFEAMLDKQWVAWFASTVQSGLIAAISIQIGIRIGPSLGLRPRSLHAILNSEVDALQDFKPGLQWALPLGAFAALIILGLDLILFSSLMPDFKLGQANTPPAWMSLLASFRSRSFASDRAAGAIDDGFGGAGFAAERPPWDHLRVALRQARFVGRHYFSLHGRCYAACYLAAY